MSNNPYENEPGFETANDESDKKNQKDYVAKVGSGQHVDPVLANSLAADPS
jgi:hypothetical protein